MKLTCEKVQVAKKVVSSFNLRVYGVKCLDSTSAIGLQLFTLADLP